MNTWFEIHYALETNSHFYRSLSWIHSNSIANKFNAQTNTLWLVQLSNYYTRFGILLEFKSKIERKITLISLCISNNRKNEQWILRFQFIQKTFDALWMPVKSLWRYFLFRFWLKYDIRNTDVSCFVKNIGLHVNVFVDFDGNSTYDGNRIIAFIYTWSLVIRVTKTHTWYQILLRTLILAFVL